MTMVMPVGSLASPRETGASPSTAGLPAMAAAGGRRGVAYFDHLLDYFKQS